MPTPRFQTNRLAATRAFLAGAAFLASATVYAQSPDTLAGDAPAEETAMANPRIGPHGGPVGLPQPLPPSEVVLLKRLFAQQARGQIQAAMRDVPKLDADSPLSQAMLGHLLAERYLGRFYRPDAAALQDWLKTWPDLPDATAIHALLLRRLPQGAPRPPAPAEPRAAEPAIPVPEEAVPTLVTRSPAVDRAVYAAARTAQAVATIPRLLAATARHAPAYAGLLRGEAARILFTQNRDEEAYAIGAGAVHGCTGNPAPDCQDAALPSFIAGLAAWRMDQPERAAAMFQAAWYAGLTTPSLQSAAAFWSARAQQRLGASPVRRRLWLHRAAAQPSSFYGLLARRSLGLDARLPGTGETLSQADVDAVAATAAGRRAFALLQLGQTVRAEAELRRLTPADPALTRALMLVATQAGLTDFAATLADALQAADGQSRALTRFAVPQLRPSGGFTVDPAMVYALARTESNFDSTLVSSAGARGLLQLMPQTAQFLAGPGGLRGTLHNPDVNLALGQRYVIFLAASDAIGGDLIRLLASYNTGLGSFARWSPALRDNNDPLLFIEAIPLDETRAFVPRVLSYTWLYAARLHLPAPSLDELAAGAWPRYHERVATIH